ncbi:MAG: GyrI-like domain-containing protein [Pseudolabrys sp.]
MSRSRLAASLALALALSLALCAGPVAAQPAAQPGAPGMDVPAPLLPGDAFGEEVTLPERTVIYLKGHTDWDAAFETLVDAFKSLHDYLSKQGTKPSGAAMTIYTETAITGFEFKAALPVAEAPKDPPKGDLASEAAPSGKALKFVHRGSFRSLDTTYEAITNYLDDKGLEARDLFIEEYATDPTVADADKLVVNVFVPLK